MKSKQQSPCSNCMHWPVVSWGDYMVAACTYCMHWPVISWGNHMVAACTYCMGSKVSSLSQMYFYSSYFESKHIIHHRYLLRSFEPYLSLHLQRHIKEYYLYDGHAAISIRSFSPSIAYALTKAYKGLL
jgi:hypothetical protein